MDKSDISPRNLYAVPEAALLADSIEFLPTTFKDAVDHFADDQVLRAAQGRELSEMIIRVKREEWNAFHRTVSQWEIDNNIGVY